MRGSTSSTILSRAVSTLGARFWTAVSTLGAATSMPCSTCGLAQSRAASTCGWVHSLAVQRGLCCLRDGGTDLLAHLTGCRRGQLGSLQQLLVRPVEGLLGVALATEHKSS